VDAPDEETAKILRDVLAWLDKKYHQADRNEKPSRHMRTSA
jgi:hypothetical protein